MESYKQEFIDFMVESHVLKFAAASIVMPCSAAGVTVTE